MTEVGNCNKLENILEQMTPITAQRIPRVVGVLNKIIDTQPHNLRFLGHLSMIIKTYISTAQYRICPSTSYTFVALWLQCYTVLQVYIR